MMQYDVTKGQCVDILSMQMMRNQIDHKLLLHIM